MCARASSCVVSATLCAVYVQIILSYVIFSYLSQCKFQVTDTVCMCMYILHKPDLHMYH